MDIKCIEMLSSPSRYTQISELIERLVNLLKRDEEAILEDAGGSDLKETTNSAAIVTATTDDDEDNRIEEV